MKQAFAMFIIALILKNELKKIEEKSKQVSKRLANYKKRIF